MEWFAAVAPTGIALWSVLQDLARDTAEDYVKDLFKDRMRGLSAPAVASDAHKRAAMKAIREFLRLFENEVKVSSEFSFNVSSLNHAAKTFLSNSEVRHILVGPFDPALRIIDSRMLASIWGQLQLPELPINFDWDAIGKQYLRAIRVLAREDNDLREAVDSFNIETAADALQTLAGVQPGFELEAFGSISTSSREPLNNHLQ
jgi:hypothetical protein